MRVATTTRMILRLHTEIGLYTKDFIVSIHDIIAVPMVLLTSYIVIRLLKVSDRDSIVHA